MGLWARFLAASLIIVTSMASATAISAFAFIEKLFKDVETVPVRVDPVETGDPQTILVLGSDVRPGEETGRSDTTLLIRIDPDHDRIALLSIPRDLKVMIPGYGRDRFNAAYSYGGIPLALSTVKRLTGLQINHVVNADFTGFADAVNALNCVFIDVDRRYYVPEGSTYSAIDPPIEAGYQKLCGLKALQYVRYRLEDNDLVRSARQQDFLREARQKVEPGRLLTSKSYREELAGVIADNTTLSDSLGDPTEVLLLLRTLLGAAGASVDEVPFPAELGKSFVTVGNESLQRTVADFEGRTDDRKSGKQPAAPKTAKEALEPKEDPPAAASGEAGAGPPMDDARAQGEQYARAIADWQTSGGERMIRFPVLYPTALAPGSVIDDDSRAFPVDGPRKYHGYKLVISMPGKAPGLTTEYYGMSATGWLDPPILENPSEEREVGGKDYLLFYDGDRLRLVGWKTASASYWITNNLLQSLEEAEMLAIARSVREYHADD